MAPESASTGLPGNDGSWATFSPAANLPDSRSRQGGGRAVKPGVAS